MVRYIYFSSGNLRSLHLQDSKLCHSLPPCPTSQRFISPRSFRLWRQQLPAAAAPMAQLKDTTSDSTWPADSPTTQVCSVKPHLMSLKDFLEPNGFKPVRSGFEVASKHMVSTAGKRPQTVWGSGRIMYDNVDDDGYDADADADDDDGDDDDDAVLMLMMMMMISQVYRHSW